MRRYRLPRPGSGRWRALACCLAICLVVLSALRLWPHAPLRAQLGASVPVLSAQGELLRLTLAQDQQYRLWTPLEQIAPVLVSSVLLYEDRAYWWHPGVDPRALLRGVWNSATSPRREGGSTITMQLARRLYGIDSRHIRGKLAQIAAALWLQTRHSKREILEAYLNSAPYGGNIEGVGAASLIYFRKSAADLTMPEALTLAVIPQNPIKRLASGPMDAGLNRELQAARLRLWGLWLSQHAQQAQAHAAEAPLVPPALARSALPFAAPHVVDMLLAQRRQGGVIEADGAIHSTLDLAMQRTLERVLGDYIRGRSSVGIRNASALLLDASTMEVRAVVGSADYRNAAIEGQVNGSLAKRSPGSTLKPFVYGLALDQGLLHPQTILKDAPVSFGPFTPENFDHEFVGPVAAQDALIRSRNIPAVSVAAKLAQPNLYQFLQRTGVSRLQREDHYGLALVLGGGELTMEELARLYAVLANEGQLQALSYTRAQAAAARTQAPQSVLSPEAAFITLDMLRQTPRPDTGAPARPPIAWKTGTSWGFRDAWTAGVFGRHVLVVWIGEFDGAGNPAYIGVEAAAPLFLRMVDALRAQRLDPGDVARRQSAHLARVEVCAATGAMPDALCPVRTNTWFIAGKSPIQTSQLHRAVWVDDRSGRLLCGPDPQTQPHAKRIVVEQWGSDLQRLFKQSGLPRRTVDERACADTPSSLEASAGASSDSSGGPTITAPLRGVTYSLRSHKNEVVVLRAEASAQVHTLYWFVGDAWLARTAPSESFAWRPSAPGSYALRVVDDQGRADLRELKVAFLP